MAGDHLPESWRHELGHLTEELRALDADIAGARALAAQESHAKLSFRREPEPEHARVYGEDVALPDGAHVTIRPLERQDARELGRSLERLSAMSAYRRFREHISRAEPEELEELTRIDHVRHEALAALSPDGSVIGVARYVCHREDPTEAIVTYVVADAWQHRGVGSALIDRLADRARSAGVQRFVATTLASDARARRLLLRVSDPVDDHEHDGLMESTSRLR